MSNKSRNSESKRRIVIDTSEQDCSHKRDRSRVAAETYITPTGFMNCVLAWIDNKNLEYFSKTDAETLQILAKMILKEQERD